MKVPLYLPAPHSCTRGGICRVPKPWNNYFAHSVTLMLLVTPFSKDTASISFIDKKKRKKSVALAGAFLKQMVSRREEI